MHDLIGLLLCSGTPLMVLGLVVGTINWSLGPIMRRSKNMAATRRFLLSDLFWLLVYLQAAMGSAVVLFPTGLPTAHRVGAMVLLCLAVTIFWLAAVLAVSEAKVQRLARRAVVFLLLLPGTVAAIVALPLLLLAFASLAQTPEQRTDHYVPGVAMSFSILAAWMIGLRWLAAWSVESDQPWREAVALEPLLSILPKHHDQGPYRPVWPRRPRD